MLYAYPGAGHLVGTLVPYQPYARSVVPETSYPVDQDALPLLWPHLLSFLAGLSSSPARRLACSP
jgi:hypothetical protein